MRTLLLLLLLTLPAFADPFTYSDASQIDFSFLRSDRPHGFLRVGPGGSFVWSDGTRARFWGINVANKNLWIPHDEIDRVVDALSRAGTNLVRFEALDSRGGMLEIAGQPGTRRIDPAKLDTLHYWIQRVKQKHMCYYLDLLDFREFKPEDGVETTLNRGARPYAMFDPLLIDLQKEYATQLLTTRNPYTRLRLVDDPDLALLEICNEHGFFINHEPLEQLKEPYRGRLRASWGAWLLKKYGTRDRLVEAWKEIQADEDPAAGTVALPSLEKGASQRASDGVEFLYSAQRVYFRTMMEHLRSIGLRIPVTAVVSNDVAPDLASVAAECDFLSENFYADHPRFEGTEWEGKFHFRNLNQLRDGGAGGFAPYTAALRWEGKPVVIREWATVWPNAFRAASVPEAVAYARLQDYDGMLLFGYKTGEYADRLIFFGYEADPTVWGLYSVGAAIFLRGDIASSVSRMTFVYTLSTLLAFPNGVTDTHRLAWIMKVGATLRDKAPDPAPADKPRPMDGRMVLQTGFTRDPLVSVMSALGFEEGSVREMMQTGKYVSTTGQITLDTKQGRILVGAPKACMIAGEIGGETLTAGALSVSSASDVGAVVALSLDGRPLAGSKKYLVKMVTVAENTGQNLVKLKEGPPPDHVLKDEGTAPVRTGGTPSEKTTKVSIDGKPVVSIAMENGTWELSVDGDKVDFACDTRNVVANVLGRRFVTGRQRGGAD